MSHIGIFGGTFDPIHNGHLQTVEHVLKERGLDKIIFMPSFVSPLKTDVQSSYSEDRLQMVRLTVESNPKFECSDYEINSEGISYTVKTLREFRRSYDEIDLIIGYDNITVFDKWRDPDEIFNLANVVVMRRDIDNPPERTNKYMSMAVYVDTPMVNISATEIRRRVRAGLPIETLVPEQVKSYIQRNKLYCPKNS